MSTKGLTEQDSDDRLTKETIQIDVAQSWKLGLACQFPSSELWGSTPTVENAIQPAETPEFNLGCETCADGCYSRSERFTPYLNESMSGGDRRW